MFGFILAALGVGTVVAVMASSNKSSPKSTTQKRRDLVMDPSSPKDFTLPSTAKTAKDLVLGDPSVSKDFAVDPGYVATPGGVVISDDSVPPVGGVEGKIVTSQAFIKSPAGNVLKILDSNGNYWFMYTGAASRDILHYGLDPCPLERYREYQGHSWCFWGKEEPKV